MIQITPDNEYDDGKRYFNAANSGIIRPDGVSTLTDLRFYAQWVKDRMAMHRMFGRDNFADGVVLRFNGECTIPGANLTYAAIRGGGRWWTTAVKPHNMGLSWERLVAEFLTYALPSSIDICAPQAVRPFFNEAEQAKLLELQYKQERFL